MGRAEPAVYGASGKMGEASLVLLALVRWAVTSVRIGIDAIGDHA